MTHKIKRTVLSFEFGVSYASPWTHGPTWNNQELYSYFYFIISKSFNLVLLINIFSIKSKDFMLWITMYFISDYRLSCY